MKKLVPIIAVALTVASAQAQTVHMPNLQVGKSKLSKDGIDAQTLTVGGRKEVQISYDSQTEQYTYGIKYGTNSVAFGHLNSVAADYAVAMGSMNEISEYAPFSIALGEAHHVAAPYGIALGKYVDISPSSSGSFVWNGDTNNFSPYNMYYGANASGTFCVNPVGGADGFFIGTNKLSSLLGGGGSGGSGVHSLKMFTDDYNSNIQGADYISSFSYNLEWSDGSELYFILGDSASNTTHMINMPSITQRGLCGRMTLYLSQDPNNDAHYTVSGGIRGLPYPEPWMEGTNKAIWKVEIEAVPGSTDWYFVGATEYENPYFYVPYQDP